MRSAVEKRNAVLDALHEFLEGLDYAPTPHDVVCLVHRARERLVVIQGAKAERAYLARSLCQMAAALRRRHHHQISRQLLEWGVERGAMDGYTFVEILKAHLLDRNFSLAEETLSLARGLSLASKPMYTAIIAAYARAGSWRRTRSLFDEATRDGLVDAYCYTALIRAYGQAGELQSAQRVFDDAPGRDR